MRVPLADLVALEDRGRVLRSRWGLGCLCFRWWVKGLRGLCPGCRVCRVGVLWANREHPSLCSISEGRLFLFVVLMGGGVLNLHNSDCLLCTPVGVTVFF